MPYLAELAKDGIIFEQMINPSGWTNENLVSIFSSLSSPVHKVETRGRNIDPDWITPIEILKQYGYAVPRLAGWQGDQNHWELGFDSVTAMHPEKWLNEHGKDGRFFLFYQFLQPHLPYNGDRRDTDLFLSYFSDSLFVNQSSRDRVMNTVFSNSVILNDGTITFKEEDKIPIHALYDGELLVLDKEIKRTIEALKSIGEFENTIIVFGADHGEEILEHGFVGHASTTRKGHLHDEIINTPFLISFPKKLPSGEIVHTQVRGIDVMPTLLSLLEIPLPDYLEGRSLLPVIRKEETQGRIAFTQTSRAGYGEPDPNNITDRIRAVRKDGWKLVHHYYKDNPVQFELYDLESDPQEQENLFDRNPDKASELSQDLMNWILKESKIRPPDPGQFSRKSYYQQLVDYLNRPEPRTDFTGVASPPVMLTPGNHEDVTFASYSGKAPFRWEGENDVPYVIEYIVGEGDYQLDGYIEVLGNEKVFGPFPKKYWDTYLTLYAPYKIRVSIDKEPREWSEWIHFDVKASGS